MGILTNSVDQDDILMAAKLFAEISNEIWASTQENLIAVCK